MNRKRPIPVHQSGTAQHGLNCCLHAEKWHLRSCLKMTVQTNKLKSGKIAILTDRIHPSGTAQFDLSCVQKSDTMRQTDSAYHIWSFWPMTWPVLFKIDCPKWQIWHSPTRPELSCLHVDCKNMTLHDRPVTSDRPVMDQWPVMGGRGGYILLHTCRKVPLCDRQKLSPIVVSFKIQHRLTQATLHAQKWHLEKKLTHWARIMFVYYECESYINRNNYIRSINPVLPDMAKTSACKQKCDRSCCWWHLKWVVDCVNNCLPLYQDHDVCLLFFYCKKRLEYFDLLNHRTSTFVLKTVSSTDWYSMKS